MTEALRIAQERIAAFKALREAQKPPPPPKPIKHERGPLAMTSAELREIRTATGRTQAQMAEALRVGLRMYKRYENGPGIPARARLRAATARRLRPKKGKA